MTEVIESLFFEKFSGSSIKFKNDVEWKINKKKCNLFNSVTANIYNIMNTTSTLKVDDFLEKKLSVLDYGIPDLSLYISAYFVDSKKISQCITHALNFYEKRVENIQVVVKDENCKKIICIMGTVKGLDGLNEVLAYKSIAGNK